MRLVIVSGLSGSGKSVALHALEDLGHYCIDNLPLPLLEHFAMQMASRRRPRYDDAAAGVDARNQPEDLAEFPTVLDGLREAGIQAEVVFLEAEDETLLKRFSETRRRHPLTGEGVPLAEAIRHERELLEPIAAQADLHIDTTRTTVHQLRELIRERTQRAPGALSLLVESFGYKHGVPPDADLVFDLRCLPNPHWEPELRGYTGLDEPVIGFLESQPLVSRMYEQLRDFIEGWIPYFERENRSYLTVALGCTGGQHRSVYLAEKLAEHFRHHRSNVLTRHRELS